jgi:hypothetical protein
VVVTTELSTVAQILTQSHWTSDQVPGFIRGGTRLHRRKRGGQNWAENVLSAQSVPIDGDEGPAATGALGVDGGSLSGEPEPDGYAVTIHG